eukprot:gene17772-21200_t
MIIRIKELQDAYRANNPEDTKPKKRFITGLKEILRAAELKKRVIGRLLGVPVKISAFGILSYDGANEIHQRLAKLTENGRELYRQQQKSTAAELAPIKELHDSETQAVNQAFVAALREKKKKHQTLVKEQQTLKQERVAVEEAEKQKNQQKRQQQQHQQQVNVHKQKVAQKQSAVAASEETKQPAKPARQQGKTVAKVKDKMIEKVDVADQLLYNNSSGGSGGVSDDQHNKKSTIKKKK